MTSRPAEVLTRLGAVLDPELDRSVVAMGFIQAIEVAGDVVDVTFRLPTQWCAASFAFMMASDMRAAIEALPWVAQARVRLLDHFAAGRINATVADQGGFADVFPGEASGHLVELRRRFAEKAFLGRQADLLRALVRDRGVAATLDLRVDALAALAASDQSLGGQAVRYLAIRRQIHGPAEGRAVAFVDLDGRPVPADQYVRHMREARRALGAAEANAEHCRLLITARTAAPAPDDHFSPAGMYE